jgi:hypothetical protein
MTFGVCGACAAGAGDLPAYPVRVACDIMVSRGTLDGPKLMEGERSEYILLCLVVL